MMAALSRGKMVVVIGALIAAAACADDRSSVAIGGGGGGPEPSSGGAGSAISGSGDRGAAGTMGGSAGAGGGTVGGGGVGSTGGGNPGGPFMPGPCPDIFSDDQLTTYEIQMAADDWNAILADFYSMQANQNAMQDIHPYHRVAEFRYGDEVITNALIRLKGYSSWWQAVSDNPPKLQFVIAFDGVDKQARFHGVRKVELDMPRIDQSYLRQRIALQYFRALGVPSQCANSGRLFINGAFYGLYTNMERPDKEFLTRWFPGQDGADLWDGGWSLQTNADTMSLPHPRLDAFWAAKTTDAIDAIADMDEALLQWAGEAMLADADGYWIGHWNFFLYDHPTRGWLWIPHDLDATIDWLDPHIDPIWYWGGNPGWAPPWQHYSAVIRDYTWRERYVAKLRHALEVYDAANLTDMVDRFEAQIRDAAAADPTRPFTFDQHLGEVAYLRLSITTRAEALRAWLACRAAPDGALDLDGDHRPFCMDCNDSDPNMYPGAVEICGDGIDQDCDGSDANSCQ